MIKDALVPALKKAMQRGIKVISWDSGVAPEGRQMHLNPSSNALIGNMCVQMAADVLLRGQGRGRHPLGHRHRHQPEHLDRGDEEGAAELSRT